jgi:hypothetical protein
VGLGSAAPFASLAWRFCRAPALAGGRFEGRRGPPEDQELAEVLHRGGVQPFAERDEETLALVPIVGMDANLDQFVRLESDVDLVEDRGRDPGVADRDDRMERVGERAELAAACRCQGGHRRSLAESARSTGVG